MKQYTKESLLGLAQQAGTTLTFNGPYVQEKGDPAWMKRRKMYQLLYRRLHEGGKKL